MVVRAAIALHTKHQHPDNTASYIYSEDQPRSFIIAQVTEQAFYTEGFWLGR